MSTISWTFEADFDRDGTYEEDLTAYVSKPGSGVAITRGIGPDGKYRVSKVTVGLKNTDGRFSDRNASSPYFGKMAPGVPVRLTATHDTIDYTLWTGYIASWTRKWKTGAVPMVSCECWDIAHYLVDSDPINVTVDDTRDTDGALDAILDAWVDADGNPYIAAAGRNFDDGVQDLPLHYVVAEKAMKAMMDVVRSEPGHLWVDAQGRLRFENRESRLGITSPDDTWGDGTGIYPIDIEDLTDDMDYITSVRARASVFAEGQAGVEIFRFSRGAHNDPANSMLLAANQTHERTYQLSQPLEAITSPEATTDYRGNSEPDGSGTDLTDDLDVSVELAGSGYFRLTIENTSGNNVYITLMRLRGQPVNFFYGDHPEGEVELGVPGLPAGKGVEIDKPFAGDEDPYQLVNDAQATLRTYRYSDASSRRSLHFIPDTDTKRAKMLALELGQLIKFKDTDLGDDSSYTDDWFYVEAIDTQVPPDWAGQSFDITVTLVPSYVFYNLDNVTWDDFRRQDTSGDLVRSGSGSLWADDSGFDIGSEVAGANTDSLSMANIALGVTDQVVEVALGNIAAGDEVGVVFRYTDANNHCRLYLDEASDELILERVVSGTVTELASPAFTVGDEHEIKAMVQGDRIRCWADFELLIDDDTGSLPSGTRVGLFARNANAGTTFDHFHARGLN